MVMLAPGARKELHFSRVKKARLLRDLGWVHLSGWVPKEYADEVEIEVKKHIKDVDHILMTSFAVTGKTP